MSALSGQQYANTANHNEHEDTEIHVEIEHITGDENEQLLDTEDTLNSHGQDELGSLMNNGVVGVANVKDTINRNPMGRRTVILSYQKKILEDFFKTGMNSASHQLRHLHEAAADQTGLELHVIKNWVRNRRRPMAAQRRQEMQQMMMMTMGTTPVPPSSTITTAPPVQTLTYAQIHTPPPYSLPEPKRVCFDRQIEGFFPLTVKMRIADSDEADFVEIELESTSYSNLLKMSCEELGVSIADVLKIRKLPNVLIRKDKDIIRMNEGQEMELVLKTAASYLTNTTISFAPPSLINYTTQDGGGSSLADHHSNSVSN